MKTDTNDPRSLIRAARVHAKAAEDTIMHNAAASQALSALSTAQSTLALALMARKES